MKVHDENIIVSFIIILTLLSWSVIFIDGSTDEGPIITFLGDGLRTINVKHMLIDIFSIIALLTALFHLLKQNLKFILFTIIYLILTIKFLIYIDFDYFSWILKPRTLLPATLFVVGSATSILTIYKRTNSRNK